MNEYTMEVTYKCNWFCNYCIMDTHNPNKIEPIEEDLIKQLHKIPKGSILQLTGGETGLMSKTLLDEVVKYSQENDLELNINTNGLFLKNFPEYVKYFNFVKYHVSENLEDLDFERYSQYDNIEYQMVVHDGLMDNLDKFMKANSDLKFSVYRAADLPHLNPYSLSTKNTFEVYKKYKDNLSTTEFLFMRCHPEAQTIK